MSNNVEVAAGSFWFGYAWRTNQEKAFLVEEAARKGFVAGAEWQKDHFFDGLKVGTLMPMTTIEVVPSVADEAAPLVLGKLNQIIEMIQRQNLRDAPVPEAKPEYGAVDSEFPSSAPHKRPGWHEVHANYLKSENDALRRRVVADLESLMKSFSTCMKDAATGSSLG